jgi:uncharacterized protein (DUF433 family)
MRALAESNLTQLRGLAVLARQLLFPRLNSSFGIRLALRSQVALSKEKKKLLSLASDLHKVWKAPTTTQLGRKCYALTQASPMTNEELLQRITIDPKVCFGKPCIRGHRIWVSLVLDFLAQGATPAQILEDYPQLEEADIMACLAYGAEMARERFRRSPN